MSEFFSICDYFNITPAEFFDDGKSNPALIQEAISGLSQLSDEDVLLVLNLVNRLKKQP